MQHGWGPQDLSAPQRKALRKVPAAVGLLLEDVESGWVGEVVRTERAGGVRVLVLEDRKGRKKSFPGGFGFLIDGEPVEIVEPGSVPAAPTKQAPQRSASGSVYLANAPARTARAARIWVEGAHDAELVEKVWGHDLRVEGVVVEPLHGVDDLAGAVKDFNPGPQRRLGVLVDHLVTGSKEHRIAQAAMAVPGARGNVLVLGHPYVDVWQAVRPGAVGLDAWPVVPRGEEWKQGILRRLGWPHTTKEDVGLGWKRILSGVRHYGDLEPSLLGRVEELIDFVTSGEA
ncbi:DUF3097 family protein [Galactobacter caseinivorans]|uniref:DUF3097 family protein n=1 Tax=Galactobacter caseinivorans TaxID=2676123 RepID=A0A496PKW7_9MICC|nr:DUF3097 family protein [Galactobacter caseinivorans]RKW71162.1 DUF3097 family protein [Galactobacter caseinivorans]